MIRTEFSNVVLCNELEERIANVDDENLLLYGNMFLLDKFDSVQGETTVASSFFGGCSTIFFANMRELQSFLLIILSFAISLFRIKIKMT